MSDEEYTRLLKQFPEKLQGALTWKKYFERLVHAGRRTGRTDIEIGDDIRNELKGQLADSTVRTYLPSSFKHMEHASEHKEPPKFSGSNKDYASPPYIPPRPEVHREAEIVREPSKAKAIDESITIPTGDKQIMLDTNKFRSDLRIALINGAKVWLSYNNAKEVIKINEKDKPEA